MSAPCGPGHDWNEYIGWRQCRQCGHAEDVWATEAQRQRLHDEFARAIADAEPGPVSTRWLRQADAVMTVVERRGLLPVPIEVWKP